MVTNLLFPEFLVSTQHLEAQFTRLVIFPVRQQIVQINPSNVNKRMPLAIFTTVRRHSLESLLEFTVAQQPFDSVVRVVETGYHNVFRAHDKKSEKKRKIIIIDFRGQIDVFFYLSVCRYLFSSVKQSK